MNKQQQVLFRASSISALMTGGNSLTQKQLDYLESLQLRTADYEEKKAAYDAQMERYQRALDTVSLLQHNNQQQQVENGTILAKEKAARTKQLANRKKLITRAAKKIKLGARPLTLKMETDLKDLREKAAAPFEFGKTAKRFIESVWLRNTFGYQDPVVSKEMLKGHLCEDDSIGLVASLLPSKQFRRKNTVRKTNEHFTGQCDIDLDSEDTIEDVKTSWDLRTFFEVETAPEGYYAQGQVYMDLYGRSKFRLYYCMVDTPEELITEEEKKFFFKFGCDYDNPNYIEVCQMLRRNHIVESRIPAAMRVKCFDFDRDQEYIDELKRRVELARKYYNTLQLIPDALSVKQFVK